MQRIIITVALLFVHRVIAQDVIVLEDFESRVAGAPLTKGWFHTSGWSKKEGEPSGVYQVLKEKDNQFLEGHSVKQGTRVFMELPKKWNLKVYPWLNFRLRPRKFPKSEHTEKIKKDNVASVYVVFPKRFFVPESMRLDWNEVVALDTVSYSNKNFKHIVIKSGLEPLDQWQSISVDVYALFTHLFDRGPSNPVSIGFLTDSDETQSEAIGDYDDFKISKKPLHDTTYKVIKPTT